MSDIPILDDIKLMLGIEKDDKSFDQEIAIHMEAAFSQLISMGLKYHKPDGDKLYTWHDLFPDSRVTGLIVEYTYLFVKRIFDPPQTSFANQAISEVLNELGWRIMQESERSESID